MVYARLLVDAEGIFIHWYHLVDFRGMVHHRIPHFLFVFGRAGHRDQDFTDNWELLKKLGACRA